MVISKGRTPFSPTVLIGNWLCDARVADPRLRAATIDWDRMRDNAEEILALLDQGAVLQRLLHAMAKSRLRKASPTWA
jgi:hypothetical protein